MGTESDIRRTARGDRACAAGVLVATLTVYIVTLAPTVTAEDSGELIAAAYTWGVAHPPGYPLWTMLCGAFMRIFPLGGVAWRANLFSGLCTSVSAAIVFLALRDLRFRRAGALAAALVWSFSGTLWSQSVITEVYGLNALLCAAVLWAIARWHVSGRRIPLMAASLAFGLGMSNHPTIGFFAVAVGLWALLLEPGLLKRLGLVSTCVALFGVGLTPYLYLPLRARADPAINWGNPATWTSFKEHVTRSQYGAFGPVRASEQRSPSRYGRQLAYAGRVVADDLTRPVAVMAVLGLAALTVRRRKVALLAGMLLASCGLLYTWMANTELRPDLDFHMKVFLIPLALVGGLGIAGALEFVVERAQRWSESAGRWIGLALAIAIACAPLIGNWKRCNYRNYWLAYDHGRNMLASTLPDALIFPSGDHEGFPLLYLAIVEGQRPDVLVVDKYGYVDPAVLRQVAEEKQLAVKLSSEADKIAWLVRNAGRPAHFAKKRRSPVANASLVPMGLTYLVLPDGRGADVDRCWNDIGYRNLETDTAHDMGRNYILTDYYFFKGLYELESGSRETALTDFSKSAEHSVAIREGLNNIGSALAEHGMTDEAIPYFEHARALDALYTTPRWNLAQIYRDHGQIESSEEVLDELIVVAPDDHRAYLLKGDIALHHHRNPGAAHRWWLQSLERQPYQPVLWKALLQLEATE